MSIGASLPVCAYVVKANRFSVTMKSSIDKGWTRMLLARFSLRHVVLPLICSMALAVACSRTGPGKPDPGAGGLTRLDPDEPDDAWLIGVQQKIYEVWRNNAPRGLPGKVVAGVSVASDGRLLDVKILESSGVVALDEYAVDAIRTAAPFSPFPPSMPGDVKVFRTRFDYGDKPQQG